MKTQDKKTLFGKTQAELNNMLADLSRDVAKNVIDLKMGKLKNVRSISVMRDDIARVKTALRLKSFEKGEK